MSNQHSRLNGYGVLGDARTSRWFGRGLVLLGVLLTCLAWQGVAQRLADEDQARFAAFGEAREQALDRHVKRLLDVALSFQGLFLASDTVTREEFRTHFEILRVQHTLPEVLAVRLDLWQADAQRLHTQFREPTGGVERPVEPPVDVLRARWVERSRDENLSVMSAPQTLSDGLLGVDIGVPVYRQSLGAGVPPSVAARRTTFLGQVNVAVELGRVVASVLPEGVNLPYRVRLRDIGTVDGTDQPEVALYDSGIETTPPWPAVLAQAPAERRYVIEVGQRLWLLSIQAPPVVYLLRPEAWLVLLCGVLGTLVLAMTLRQLQRRMERSAEALRAMDQQAEFDDARLRGVIDQSTEGIVTFDRRGVLLAANPAAESMFRRGALAGMPLDSLIDPSDRPALQHLLQRWSQDDAQFSGSRLELRAVRADASVFPLSLACRPLVSAAAGGECLGMLRDLSPGQRAAAAMRKLAQHDALTGLINREAFQKRLADALDLLRAQPPLPWPLAMLVIDLDRFKKINETLGHLVGDRVLLEIAARLRGALDEDATLARLGGDEFAVLLQEPRALEVAQATAQRILRLLSEPLEVDGHRLRISGSIGITSVESGSDLDGVDGMALMRQADSAMYAAKNAGRSQVRVHRREDQQYSPEQLQREVDLHRALERQELELYFQPQFDCRTQALVGAEALLRWHHHSQGMVSPADFIPMAEESGLIVPIGRWVLDEACRHARAWQALAGGRALSVAVNVSSRQMVDDDIVCAVRESLDRHGLSPDLLELEITESAAVTDTEQARGLLDRLAALGVSVSIDDFGVGYSSLSYLRDLPVQRFKIDRSFLANVPQDAGSSRLVSAMISMARSLEVGLVAEGVETPEQLAFLAEQHCDVAQGYLLGRPVPAEEFLRRLREDWLKS